MRPLASSDARRRSRRIHGGRMEVLHGQCRLPKAEDGWGGRCGRLVGGLLALPKNCCFHANFGGKTNRPDRRPVGRSPEGVSLNLGWVGGMEKPGGAVAMEAGDFHRFGAGLKGRH